MSFVDHVFHRLWPTPSLTPSQFPMPAIWPCRPCIHLLSLPSFSILPPQRTARLSFAEGGRLLEAGVKMLYPAA